MLFLVDQECATTGQMQIPVGMTYNTSSLPARFQNASMQGGIIHAWHSQSWAMHMFEIAKQNSPGELTFAKGGGKQGGRNWCRVSMHKVKGNDFERVSLVSCFLLYSSV